MKIYSMNFGKKKITNLEDPAPDQIDLAAIDERLNAIKRWSFDPRALTARQHADLVALLMGECGEPDDAVEWARHHNDRVVLMGNIASPIKELIFRDTSALAELERSIDHAIAKARGIVGPTPFVRERVKLYSKAAETLEWLYLLHEPPAEWNCPLPPEIPVARLKELLFYVVRNPAVK